MQGAARFPTQLKAARTIAAVVAFGLFAAGCVTAGAPLVPMPGSTVAFESIDGPPAHVFRKYVEKLNAEAEARKVPVVSREAQAPYRIRGYLALGIEKKQKRTVIAWVWDVYDSGERRALRISGEEYAGPAGRDPWSAANEEVLGRLARAGMERLAAYFQTGTVPPQPGAEPQIAPSAPAPRRPDENPNVAAREPSPATGGRLALALAF
ncbi:MAG: hypothetical protein AB7K35_07430 [Pseudorhodoplanes sp.]